MTTKTLDQHSFKNYFKLFLTLFFAEKLVRLIIFKFHGYFNSHKMNAIEATLMPCLILLSSIFIKFKTNKNSVRKTLDYNYPHLKTPYRSYLYSNTVRFILQSIFLAFVKKTTNRKSVKENVSHYFYEWVSRLFKQFRWLDLKLGKMLRRLLSKNKQPSKQSAFHSVADARVWKNKCVRYIVIAFALFLLAIFITIPFSLEAQAIFISFILLVAYSLKRIKGQMATIVMITLSVTTSSRYLWWRYTETLNWDDPLALILGAGLLLAETYAWLVLILGFFQTINPLERKPVPLPKDTGGWPTVDVYIPTYNEPLSVVKPTTLAALSIDWPADKLNVYILDDGNRS